MMPGIAPLILWLSCGLTLSLVLGAVSPMIVRRVSSGRAGIGWKTAFVASLAGTLPGFAAVASGSPPSVVLSFTLFGTFLLLLAIIDRQTSWAPDMLMLPLCCLAMWVGAQHGGQDPGVFRLLLRGLGLFGLAQILFVILARLARPLPPPDMIGLLLPFVVFGISAQASVAFIITSAILILIRQSGGIRNRLLTPEVGTDVSVEGRLSVPFLAIVLPVVYCLMFLSPLVARGG